MPDAARRTRPKVSPLRMQSPSFTDHSVCRSASTHLNTCVPNTRVCEPTVQTGSKKKHQ